MSNYYKAYPIKKIIKWVIPALIILILAVSSISSYNGLVAAEQDVKSKWSQVENVMQRRADLITNSVEVVKGYVKHEEKVFGDIAAARSVLMDQNAGVNEKLAADEQIAESYRSFLVMVENYPDLKADQQFTNLQVQLEGSENRVSVERKNFIDSVQKYNTNIKRFPKNIFARILGFESVEYFQASPGAQEAPKVEF
jgi:LemA protein